MDLHDNSQPIKRFFKSFSFAAQGIVYGVRKEANLKFHLFVTLITVASGFFFSISKIEWLMVLSAVFGMIALELMNTAVEKTVDLVTKDYHHLAKAAKDTAAGAVLIYAVYAVIVGIIVFLPKVVERLS